MKDLPESDLKEVEFLVHRIVNKLLHKPSRNLKKNVNAEDTNFYLESITEIFDLNPPQVNLEKLKNSKSRLKVIKF